MKKPLVLSAFLSVFLVLNSFAQETGFLNITSNITDFFVIIDNNYRQAQRITKPDTLELPVGKHFIRIASYGKKDFSFVANISHNSLTTKNIIIPGNPRKPTQGSYPRLYWKANLMVFTEPGATIKFGDLSFNSPIASINAPPGEYVVTVNNDGIIRSRKVYLWNNRLNTINLTTLPHRGRSILFSVVPGASQLYKDQYVKSIVFSSLFAGLLTKGISLNREVNDSNDRYRNLVIEYNKATDPVLVSSLAETAKEEKRNSNSYAKQRDQFLIATGIIYLASMVDGIFVKPKDGYFKKIEFNPYTDFSADNNIYFGINVTGRL